MGKIYGRIRKISLTIFFAFCYVYANADLTGAIECNDVYCVNEDVEIKAIVSGGNKVYYRFSIDEDQKSDFDTENTYSQKFDKGGTYKIVAEFYDANDPTNIKIIEKTIEVRDKPVARTGGDLKLCEGDNQEIGMDAVSGVIYSWYPEQGLQNPNSSKTLLSDKFGKTPATGISYTLKAAYEDLPTCYSESNINIITKAKPVADPGIDRTVCEGSVIKLGMTAIEGVSYNWQPASVFEDATISDPTTKPLETNINSLTMTASLDEMPECKATASINITVVPKPQANAGADITICEGTSVRIGSAAQSDVVYTWDPITYIQAGGESISNPITTELEAGNYSWTLTAASSKLPTCKTTDMINIHVSKRPTAYAGEDQTICKGGLVSLGRASESGVEYYWTPQVFEDYKVANPTFSNLNKTTEFTLTASLADIPSCSSESKVTITVKDLPIINAGKDTTICEGRNATIGSDISEQGIKYIWSPNMVETQGKALTKTNDLVSTTKFILTAQSISIPSCINTDTVLISVKKRPEKLDVEGGNYYCEGADLSDNIVTLKKSKIGTDYALFKNDAQASEWTPGNGSDLKWDRLEEGIYNVYGKNEQVTCESSMNGNVIISKNDLPTATIKATPDSICIGNEVVVSINLTGVPPFKVTLQNSNGKTQEIETLNSTYEIKETPLGNTTWRITKVKDNICENQYKKDIPETSVKLHTTPSARITATNGQKYVCKGQPITLKVDFPAAGETYKWSTGETTDSITVSPTITSTYLLTTTNNKGCYFTDQIEISVKELPQVSIVGLKEDEIYCSNEEKILLTGIPAGGQFSGAGISGEYFNPENAVGIGQITYEYIDLYGCKNDSVANVYVNQAPEVEFTIPALEFGAPYKKEYHYCSPPDEAIEMQGIPKIDEGVWTLHAAAPNAIDAKIEQGAKGAAKLVNCGPGTYTIEYSYTDNKNCSSSIIKQLEINVNEPVNIDMGDIVSLAGDTLCSLSEIDSIKADLTGGVFTVSEDLLIDQDSALGFLRINPSNVVAPSTYGIGYTLMDIKGCPHNLYKEIYITTPVNVRAIKLDSFYCEYDEPVSFNLTSYINFPTKGKVSIIRNDVDTVWANEHVSTTTPMSDNSALISEDIQFKPQWGPGKYLITYDYVDKYCEGIPYTVPVNVYPRPEVSFDMPKDYCYLDTITLNATPSGGLFTMATDTGKVVYQKKIYTQEIGSGKRDIYYEYKSDHGCVNYDTSYFIVHGVEKVEIIGLLPEYCENAGEVSISANPFEFGTPTFSTATKKLDFLHDLGNGQAKIDLSVLNLVGTYDVRYNYEQKYKTVIGDSLTCNMDVTNFFKILGKNANFTGIEDGDTICGNTDSIKLYGIPSSGSYSISDQSLKDALKDNEDGTATLYPTKLIEKDYSITYTYKHYNEQGELVCETQKTKAFYVSPIKDFDFTTECNGEDVTIKMSGSEENAKYILYKNAFASDTVQGTGGAISFAPFSEDAYCKIYAIKRGCIAKMSKELKISPLNINIEKIDISCYKFDDGKAIASVSGGTYPYSFNWTGEKGYKVNDSVATSLPKGKYIFKVTDAIGCERTDSIEINESDSLSITIDEIAAPLCAGDNNGTAKAVVKGGVPNFSFEWINLETGETVGNNATISNIETGNYQIKVTDKNGCVATDRTTLIKREPITIKIEDIEHNKFYGDETGSISISVNGGVSPYEYSWKGLSITEENQNDKDISKLHAGNYFITVTDANGCTKDTVAIVNQPEELTVTEVITNLNCFSDKSGAIDITVKGGQAEYDFLWTGDNGFSSTKQNISNLAAGVYNIKITDANGKIYKNSYEVKEPRHLSVNTLSQTDTIIECFGDSSGIINIEVVGGISPYNINWNSKSIAINPGSTYIEHLTADNYLATITDAAGCKTIRKYTIKQPAKLTKTGLSSNISCPDKSDGSIVINTYGGVGPYNYFWSGGNAKISTRNQNNLIAGDYYLQITDANGCTTDTSFQLSAPVTSTVKISTDNAVCANDSTQLRFDFTGTPNWSVSYNNAGQTYVLTTDKSPITLNVLPKANAKYEIIAATDGNHCNAEIINDASPSILPIPEISLVSYSANTCLDDSVEVEVLLQRGEMWNINYKEDDAERRITNITDAKFKFKIKPSRIGEVLYEITSVENEHCKKDVSIKFASNIHDYPNIAITAPEYLCQGEESKMKIDITGEDAPWSVDYYVGAQQRTDVFTTNTGVIKDVLNSNTAYNFYAISSSFGCKREIDKRVNVEVGKLPADAIMIKGEAVACMGSSYLFSTPAVANATSYHWTLPEGVVFAGGTGSNEVLLLFTEKAESGLITVQGKNDCGLGGFASMYVKVPKVLGKVGSIYAAKEVCKNSAPISISTSIIENADKYVWELPAGFSITFGDSSASIIATLNPDVQPGTISVYGKNQCHTSDTISIELKLLDVPIAEAGPALVTKCENSIVMEARDPSPNVGTWKLAEGSRGIIKEPHNPNTEITNLGYGENKIYWIVSNGKCSDTDSTIVNNVNVDMTQPDFYTHTTCLDTIRLNAKEPRAGIGEWSQVGGTGEIVQDGPTSAVVSGISMATNTYRWRVFNEKCSKDTIVIVNSNSPAQYAFAGNDTLVTKDYITLSAKYNIPEVNGVWTIISGENSKLGDKTSHSSTIEGLSPGLNVLRWTVTYKGCSAFDEINIEYVEEPIAGLSSDKDHGCSPLEVTFANKTIGDAKFFWDFGDGSPIVTDQYPSAHTYTKGGKYTVKLTAIGEYKTDSAFLKIDVIDAAVAEFKALKDTIFLPDAEVRFLNQTVDGIAYKWDFGDGSTSIEENPTHVYKEQGLKEITLSVIDKNGCESDSTVTVFVANMFIVFPNAFIPDIENENGGEYTLEMEDVEYRSTKVFYPIWKGVDTNKEYTLQIFNRWGELIYQSKDLMIGWDGYIDGKLVPQGIYFYKAIGSFADGKGFTKTGEVSVIR